MWKYLIIGFGLMAVSEALLRNKNCLLKGACDGEPYETYSDITASSCSYRCIGWPLDSCHWFTYIKDTQTCLLFSECPDISPLESDSITNEAGCLIPSDCETHL